jgi:hypothetical protein
MGLTVDHHPARPADALAAIVVEGDRLLTLGGETLVECVEHLQEGHVLGDPVDLVDLEPTGTVGALLTPDLQDQVHL